MASGPDDWMVQVELVEDDEPGSGDARSGARSGARGPGAPGSGGGGGRVSRLLGSRRRRWILAGALAAVVVLGAVNLVFTPSVEVPATPPPGSTISLDEPLLQVGQSSAGDVLGVAEGTALLAVQRTRERVEERLVVAVDAVTGEQRWELMLGPSTGVDVCHPAVTGEPAVLWCWRYGSRDPEENSNSRPAAAMAIGVEDGDVVSELAERFPAAGLAAHDGALITADIDGDTLTVRKVEPVNWSTVWSQEMPLLPRVPYERYQSRVEVVGDLVVVRGPTAAVLDAASGRILGVWQPIEDPQLALPGAEVVATVHGFAVWAEVVNRRRSDRGAWYDTEGNPRVEFEGGLAEPVVSDDAAPRVLLVNDGDTLIGVDVGSGTELWSHAFGGGVVLARYSEVVILARDGEVTAVGALSGLELWSTEIGGLRPRAGAISDGRSLAVMAVQNQRWVIVSLRLTDGNRLWSDVAPGSPNLEVPLFVEEPPRLEAIGDRPVIRSGVLLTWLG